MKSYLFKMVLCLSILSISFTTSADAANQGKSSNTVGMIYQVAVDGGIAYSFSMTVYSNIIYEMTKDSNNVKKYLIKQSKASLTVPTGAAPNVHSCQTYISLRKQTKYGDTTPNQNWDLPFEVPLLVNPNVHFISGSFESALYGSFLIKYSPPSTSTKYENLGRAASGLCIGGGTVTNTWSFTY